MNRKTVSILTVIFLAILMGILGVFMQSQAKINQAEEETLALIEYDYQVDTINKFYWVTIGETYFSIDFVDETGQQRYAIIAQEGGDMQYYTADEIISEQDANAISLNDTGATDIVQTRLGLMDSEPVWEITLRNENNTITYYYIKARDGAWVQTISNI